MNPCVSNRPPLYALPPQPPVRARYAGMDPFKQITYTTAISRHQLLRHIGAVISASFRKADGYAASL